MWFFSISVLGRAKGAVSLVAVCVEDSFHLCSLRKLQRRFSSAQRAVKFVRWPGCTVDCPGVLTILPETLTEGHRLPELLSSQAALDRARSWDGWKQLG